MENEGKGKRISAQLFTLLLHFYYCTLLQTETIYKREEEKSKGEMIAIQQTIIHFM